MLKTQAGVSLCLMLTGSPSEQPLARAPGTCVDNLSGGCSLCTGIQLRQKKNVLSFFPGSTWAWWVLLSLEGSVNKAWLISLAGWWCQPAWSRQEGSAML